MLKVGDKTRVMISNDYKFDVGDIVKITHIHYCAFAGQDECVECPGCLDGRNLTKKINFRDVCSGISEGMLMFGDKIIDNWKEVIKNETKIGK